MGGNGARYAGLVFDMDGTLIDSPMDFAAMHQAAREIAAGLGVPTESLEGKRFLYQMSAAVHEWLGPRAPEKVRTYEEELEERLDRIELAALSGVHVLPGAEETLAEMAGAGLALGLLTRSCEPFATAALEQTGLRRFFPVVSTRNTPGPRKPDPRSLWNVLERMGVPGHRAAYIGDRALDLTCARDASVDFVGVVWPGKNVPEREREFAAGGGCTIVRSFPELLEEVLRR